MADRNVTLAIDVAVDAKKAAAGFDSVGAAALDMSRDVKRAADTVDRSTRDVAESVDNVGSASSQAAGGVGDLGGALALMPGPLGAVGAGMEAVAPAIMGVTGAADLMSLAMNSSVVATTRAKVASIGHRAATIAQNVATKAAAAGQWALNVAMSANPIGLIIVAIIALVAGFVLLYKRSKTVRDIVDKVWQAIKTAGRWLFDLGKTVGGFLLKWSPMGIAIRLIRDNFGQVTGKVRDLVGWLRDKLIGWLGKVKEKGASVATWLKDTLGEAFRLATSPIRTMIDVVKDVIDWLGKIKVPEALSKIGDAIGGLIPGAAPVTYGAPQLSGGVGRLDPRRGITAAAGTPVFTGLATRGGGAALTVQPVTINVPITVNGALDADAVGEQLVTIIRRTLRKYGPEATL